MNKNKQNKNIIKNSFTNFSNLIKGIFTGNTPARMIFKYYLTIITVGAILLILPISLNSNKSLNFLDGLFTATSAASVTGLGVVDTKEYFNIFGQIVIITGYIIN